MEQNQNPPQNFPVDKIPAGKMPSWDVGELPAAPRFRLARWTAIIGPGLMMAGANIGGGEWLFGPAVTAQYGGMVMWIASLSILFQVFYNLEVMRYTLYCGEPIVSGFFRLAPGPRFWTFCYLFLDFGAIWPYLASSAAVPLAAAILGELPGPGDQFLVSSLGYAIFLSALVPLIFGGKIYNALEKVMVAKIILVLGYLAFIAIFMCSSGTAKEIFSGFFRFGTIPLRAQTVVVGDRFTLHETVDGETYLLKGTFRDGLPTNGTSLTYGAGRKGQQYNLELSETPSPEDVASPTFSKHRTGEKPEGALAQTLTRRFHEMLAKARAVADRGGFYFTSTEDGLSFQAEGTLDEDRNWVIEKMSAFQDGEPIDAEQFRARIESIADNQGNEPVNIFTYAFEKQRLPDLNWSVLAGFAAIAGAGGLNNAQFSNYARDKGWGMGPLVGAIPSAVGGKTISLSHVGRAFRPGQHNKKEWRGWIYHIVRDQVGIWTVGCFLGMALPAMLSLEFIRNAPVSGNQLAAMTADGLSAQAGWIFWPMTLLCGFLVLGPSQVANMDGILRRWTDVIWTGSPKVRHLEGNKVKYVYYGIMVAYMLWGLMALYLIPDSFVLTQASTVFMNLALGFSALHTLAVNLILLPKELRPNWLMRLGLIGCALFFLGICGIALNQQLPRLMDWLSTRWG